MCNGCRHRLGDGEHRKDCVSIDLPPSGYIGEATPDIDDLFAIHIGHYLQADLAAFADRGVNGFLDHAIWVRCHSTPSRSFVEPSICPSSHNLSPQKHNHNPCRYHSSTCSSASSAFGSMPALCALALGDYAADWRLYCRFGVELLGWLSFKRVDAIFGLPVGIHS